jgi:hypothetical protein
MISYHEPDTETPNPDSFQTMSNLNGKAFHSYTNFNVTRISILQRLSSEILKYERLTDSESPNNRRIHSQRGRSSCGYSRSCEYSSHGFRVPMTPYGVPMVAHRVRMRAYGVPMILIANMEKLVNMVMMGAGFYVRPDCVSVYGCQ